MGDHEDKLIDLKSKVFDLVRQRDRINAAITETIGVIEKLEAE